MSEAKWDREVDVLVVGTGNGALTAALCNWEMGTEDVLIIEKTDKVGGTSATSGGGIWIPVNHYAKACGADDSAEDAKKYLMGTLFGEDVPEEMIDTYIEQSPKMLKFLADRTDVIYESLEHYPDYYTNYDGAKSGHRSLEPKPIAMSELGDDWKNVRWTHHMMRMFSRIHFTQVEAHTIMTQAPGWKSLLAKMILGYVTDISWRFRTAIDRRLCTGSAGIARLYLSVKKRGIPLLFNSRMTSLIEDGGRVTGVIVQQGGKTLRIGARKGVVLGAGGFEKNQALREQYLPAPTNTQWSAGNPANEGDALLAGLSLGAKTRLMKDAWWTTTLCVPDEPTPRLAIMEKSFPGSCVVNRAGERFANESQNYMAFQKDLFATHSDTSPNAPAWQIFDARFRRNFMVGPLMTAAMKPDWQIPKSWFETGFVAKANSIHDLAEQVGIDAQGLEATIAKMNRYAETGTDEDFHRGESAYDRYYADPNIKPNPCLASIDEGPFYAMRIEAGDFGTLGGLDTDVHGRVKLEAGGVVEGLFAVGNCSAAILPTYPGPGATLGPAMTMAYQSAKLINGVEG
ncbi:MAG: FAD-binding protein [Halieaceae bacterium]|jgi:3-oxosteroid 1-dehydrogenase|uniref:3-ketosteroid-dehydrogenase, putative n=1 Tax=uncultured marine bacterium 442 TaxID=257392 RepID=Q6SH91_9BACT|nr:3-ketosteroid-dehydrogenase, putative [uncultured marine bacterium 442]MBT4855431.1 FAD-binding protein [Halieaceae bacterium]MDG1828909.1 FAD-binding protein [Luminiphilus sp.]MBT5207754.1 FAD-binding protein [Halieaceae bacterium]MBT6332920.1 FAD-binding protein [Halieaceae bacterium]